jgi:O-antigen/teichoic acid export membrane protein
MSDYRPRLSLSRAGEIWGFSRWLILARFTMLVNRQFDRWVVGSVGGASAMGNYFIAQDFASSPSDEIVAPMARAAFPVYSRLRSEAAALGDALHRMLSSVTGITFATGLGIAAVAEDFVHVVLGDKWVGVIPIIPWLGLFAATYGVARTIDAFLIATGSERASALLGLGYAILVVPVLWYAGQLDSIQGIAATKACTAFILVGTLIRVAVIRSPVGLQAIWSAVWPPMMAAASMFASVKALQVFYEVESHLLGLLRDVTFGAALYVAVSVLIWWVRGRPAGLESDLIREVRQRLGWERGEQASAQGGE